MDKEFIYHCPKCQARAHVTQLTKGQHVQVFEDPLTQTKFESEAVLLSFRSASGEPNDPNYMEYWNVEFVADDKFHCARWIQPKGASVYAT